MPSSYLSPLGSPALEGQHYNNQVAYSRPPTSSSSLAASPIERGQEAPGDSTQPQGEPARKLRKKGNMARSQGQVGERKTASKAQGGRRKGALPPAATATEKQPERPREQMQPSGSNLVSLVPSTMSSDTSSVSPEHLADTPMGPPPRPGSVGQSPSILAKRKSASAFAENEGPVVATPASLMRLQPSKENIPGRPTSAPSQTGEPEPILEDLALPEAATSPKQPPNLARIDTALAEHSAGAREGSQGTPLSATPVPLTSERTSPLNGLASPTSATAPPSGKASARGGRGSKQRNGTSTLPSPALRPKISPNIKPLLPEGGKSTTCTRIQHPQSFLDKMITQRQVSPPTRMPSCSLPNRTIKTSLTAQQMRCRAFPIRARCPPT